MAVSSRPTPPIPSTLPPTQVAALRRALAYIDANLQQPVLVEQMAAAACVSRFHLARLFRAGTGMSPTAYLRQRRIEHAQQLLHAGGLKVSQIASSLCFFDQSHFVRSFRAVTGCTPRHFARRSLRPGA
ncbi:AraC family transcriptional regulator [Stenotrophomonas sp. 364]|jgi:AraC-like DNA-binding protein|uniref:helix-turn-helix domain-containing protein n=1 Tax=Stenotrophomonas sp. 364 TaxID=2691571 RepID=UPI001318EA71|nr:AraC family transcriptional regulator [Stenotrophomonas sp. 364]QHB71524.1 helix-turn-helix domain-containing protein [Stenotrophomonas sp. 364]